ncbi:reprolysin-like metallopeptidase [Halpernia sp. GG3]
MIKKFTPLAIAFITFFSLSANAQWTKTNAPSVFAKKSDNYGYYKLDLNKIRTRLITSSKVGKNAQSVIIEMPTAEGRIEKFAVYSYPVMDEALEAKYSLGSYVGKGVDDPTKYVRFSVAPNDFQSMMISGDKYEFIEPSSTDKSVYSLHSKSIKQGGFVCNTKENPASQARIQKMMDQAQIEKSSNKTFHTLRLALSVTGEYTVSFGGTAGALTQMNATMTRVNGVFEQEFNTHLNIINAPNLIFTDASTDPYSPANRMCKWNNELLNTLHGGTYGVTDANFDIGHLFGASGGGGNAGCIGCIGSNDVSTTSYTAADGGCGYAYILPNNYKGSGITSPGSGTASNDSFDIDFVAHEMGHQLGDNHTFSRVEGTGVEVEPGSGSTIMAYAGVTGIASDVQPHSDPYFHTVSIDQVQAAFLSIPGVAADTPIANNGPIVPALTKVYNIPLDTAFVLTASATDPENNPLTYCWEQVDPATTGATFTTQTNFGKSADTGASFRSLLPTTNPTRYFPKLSTVLSGSLRNTTDWEAASPVARTTNFRITVRDNVSGGQAQTAYATQKIIVGNTPAFTVAAKTGVAGSPVTLTWVVSGTNVLPYNVTNVKIDYTNDAGATWNVLVATTANNGSASVTFPITLGASTPYVRVSAIGNVFYAVNKITLTANLATSELEKNKFQIYPNPAKDILFVRNASVKSGYIIYDITGRVVLKGNLNNGEIKVSSLSKGVYVISLNNAGKTLTSKFIKE